jgi:conjugal transfer/entry exclusion protein
VTDMARPIRDRAVRKIDDALSSRYVRQEDMAHALDELTRVLSDRFDAEAEAVAVIGQRLEALALLVEQMQEELLELRSRQ